MATELCYAKGDASCGFTCIDSAYLEDIAVAFSLWQHDGCGARVIHLGNDDPDNLFSLNFRTLPESSSGVAHVLEHTVLCGSEKYQSRDPFFTMAKRSLATFMNAMTGQDTTYYPASSCVEADFYNLLDVYLDAVFFPNLTRLSFLQEGHRLDIDDEGKATLKGIVFNEMKGAMSDPEARLFQAVNQALFPDTIYAHNSGGDPLAIPDLTHEDLLAFHQRYYAPSRCVFYFYGSLPLEKHLQTIDARVLAQAKQLPELPALPLQTPFNERLTLAQTFPGSPDANHRKSLCTLAWKLPTNENYREVLAWQIIDRILFSNDGAPLARALLESGLADDVSNILDVESFEMGYLILLRGCRPDHAKKAEKLIFETLVNLCETGIEQDLIDIAIHTIEIAVRDIGSHYGLSLMFRALQSCLNNGDVKLALAPMAILDELRIEAQSKPIFENLIRQWLIDNHHNCILTMEPDADQAARESESLQQRASALAATLTDVERQDVRAQNEALEALQSEAESHAIIEELPKLTVADIDPKSKNLDLLQPLESAQHLYYHDCHTNSVVHVDLAMNIDCLSVDALLFLPIYTELLTELGCDDRDYAALLRDIARYTGGIFADVRVMNDATDTQKQELGLVISGRALGRHCGACLDLMYKVVMSCDFDNRSRIKQILHKLGAEVEASLSSAGARFAVNLAVRDFSKVLHTQYQWNGLAFVDFIRDILAQGDAGIEKIRDEMLAIRNALSGKVEPQLVVSCDRVLWEQNVPHFRDFLDKFAVHQDQAAVAEASSQPSFQPVAPKTDEPVYAVEIDSSVAYTAYVVPTVPYTHSDIPLLSVLGQVLTLDFLHIHIRERGGAYGGGASNGALNGIFVMRSHSDPNICTTFETYARCADFIADELTQKHVDAGILQVIAAVDAPRSPGAGGAVAFFRQWQGLTPARRQAFRDGVLAADVSDLRRVAKTYLNQPGKKVVLAGDAVLKRESMTANQKY